jgi:hypothetical protein
VKDLFALIPALVDGFTEQQINVKGKESFVARV